MTGRSRVRWLFFYEYCNLRTKLCIIVFFFHHEYCTYTTLLVLIFEQPMKGPFKDRYKVSWLDTSYYRLHAGAHVAITCVQIAWKQIYTTIPLENKCLVCNLVPVGGRMVLFLPCYTMYIVTVRRYLRTRFTCVFLCKHLCHLVPAITDRVLTCVNHTSKTSTQQT